MKRKDYLRPTTQVVKLRNTGMLLASNLKTTVTNNSTMEITYEEEDI